MTFREDATINANRARKRGGGAPIAIGGGLGSLVLVALFVFLGGNPDDLQAILGEQNQQQTQQQDNPEGSGADFQHCKTGADANKHDDCRIILTAQSLDEVWGKILPEQANLQYSEAGLTIFDQATDSGCGRASAATGPFYCPTDQTAYFDVSFFGQLRGLGARNAPFAQEYIVAHEFGHHIQKLENTLQLSNYNQPGADSNAVKIELQADCYAGLWAHHAEGGSALQKVTEAEMQDAIAAAQAVGDDNIQRRSGGDVRPEAWTHGSSQQRAEAFMSGYTSGKMSACDTLNRGVYR